MTFGGVSYRTFRVWQRNSDVFLRLWQAELVWPVVEPILIILALGLGLGTFVELGGDQTYVQFLTPGILAVYPMWGAVAECAWGSYVRMSMQRTYDAIIATPVNLEDVIAGEIFWGATRSLISTFYILLVAVAFTPSYGLVNSPLVILVLPVAVLQGLMFASISMSYTSTAVSLASLNYFFSLVVTPMFWLGGVFFPLDSLPRGFQVLAWFLPVSHVAAIDRGLVEGNLHWSNLGDLVWVLVVAVVFFRLAIVLMRRRLIR
jgi:lipooligosaccharide transport system permease protein